MYGVVIIVLLCQVEEHTARSPLTTHSVLLGDGQIVKISYDF